MLPLADWPIEARRNISGVFTDIDDTLTTDGAVTPDALQALADLKGAGLKVVAITGRPIGWCEALTLPVDAIVAENGSAALIFNEIESQASENRRRALSKIYQNDLATRQANFARMQQVAQRVQREVPGARVSRDSASRETDLAFDYNEHAHLPPEAVSQVLAVLRDEGMHTTVSSIHIHGCFGAFDKWRGACWIARELWNVELAQALDDWVFVGDSGNDLAMFQHFTHSVGVANIERFLPQLSHKPQYVAQGARGAGFAEVARAVLLSRP